MANDHRHRNEYDKPRSQPVTYTLEINIGDLVWHDLATAPDTLKKASALTYVDTPSAQREFAAKFRGVSRQHTPIVAASTDKTHINPITILTSGVFEFPCEATDWKLGDLIAVAEKFYS